MRGTDRWWIRLVVIRRCIGVGSAGKSRKTGRHMAGWADVVSNECHTSKRAAIGLWESIEDDFDLIELGSLPHRRGTRWVRQRGSGTIDDIREAEIANQRPFF